MPRTALIYSILPTACECILILLQEFLRLIHLGSKVRASSAIWMVEQHQLSVVLPNLFFREIPFAVVEEETSIINDLATQSRRIMVWESSEPHLSCNMRAASLRFIRDSNPPL